MKTLKTLLFDWWQLARSSRARPYLLITLLVDGAFAFVFLVAIQSYLPEQHGVSAAWPGYALAAYGAAKLAAQLFAGRLIDHAGRKQGLLFGLILILAGQALLLPAASMPFAVFPAAAVYGTGAAVLWPALFALASGSFDESERARLTSAMMLTTGLALAAGLGLGFLLPPGFPYVAAAALAFGVIGVAFVFAMRSRPEQAKADAATAPAKGSLRTVARDVLQPQRLTFSLIVLLQAVAAGALLAVFRSYGRDFLGVSLRSEALILGPGALTAAASVAVGGVLADRFGRGRVLTAGYLVAAPAFLVLASAKTPAVVAVVAMVAGLGLGVALPSITATSMDLSHKAGQGTLLSWFMAVEGLGHAIGPALGGYVSDAGDVEAVLRLAGALFALLALAALALSLALAPRRAGAPQEVERVLAEDGL